MVQNLDQPDWTKEYPKGQFLDQSASPGIHVHWVTSTDPMEFMNTFMQMTARYT